MQIEIRQQLQESIDAKYLGDRFTLRGIHPDWPRLDADRSALGKEFILLVSSGRFSGISQLPTKNGSNHIQYVRV